MIIKPFVFEYVRVKLTSSKKIKESYEQDKISIAQRVPGGSDHKESACNAGDLDSIPGSGRSPRERNGNPLQSSCLGNPMDGGAWWTIVQRVTKSWT